MARIHQGLPTIAATAARRAAELAEPVPGFAWAHTDRQFPRFGDLLAVSAEIR
jgi:hypothetical protein